MRKCGKKNIVESDRPQMTVWGMRIACWIPNATNTHSEYIYYLLLFHCKNGRTNAHKCHVIRILPVLFSLHTISNLPSRQKSGVLAFVTIYE